jgi:transposase-like protein
MSTTPSKPTLELRMAAEASLHQVLATTVRDEAIRTAALAGASLRDIAEATRMSHMSVKRIIDRSRGSVTKVSPVS